MAERTAAQQKIWDQAVEETTAEMESRLEEIRNEAYEEGVNAGREAGFDDGYDEGYSEASGEALEDGKHQGAGDVLEGLHLPSDYLYDVADRIGREYRLASASERHEKVTMWVEDLVEAVNDLEHTHYEYKNRYGF